MIPFQCWVHAVFRLFCSQITHTCNLVWAEVSVWNCPHGKIYVLPGLEPASDKLTLYTRHTDLKAWCSHSLPEERFQTLRYCRLPDLHQVVVLFSQLLGHTFRLSRVLIALALDLCTPAQCVVPLPAIVTYLREETTLPTPVQLHGPWDLLVA